MSAPPTLELVPPEGRLDSWKEIAAYLGRNERTVRRWEESEGLPVHRLVHEKRGTVYAYRSELDAWRVSRKQVVEEQEQGQEQEEPSVATAGIRRRKLNYAAAALALVGIGLGAWAFLRFRPFARPSFSSVAVLPFDNLSHDPSQEWFSDGMTETLITELSKVHALKVISRTSVMRFKGVRKPLKQIGSELGVDAVVEGSALRVGDHVRITAQLIATSTDTHLWGNDFDADMKDVFALQREVARAIAREAGATLAQGERPPAASTNPQAMAAYLRGLYQFNRDELPAALVGAREAIQLDPRLAGAHELLGGTLLKEGDFHRKPYAEIVPEARASLQRALELEPDRGVSWAWLGWSYFVFEHDWMQGEEKMRQGFELDPSTGNNLAFLLAAQGKYQEAVQAVDRALLNDPANPTVLADAALIHQFARRYDDAVQLYRKALQLNPSDDYPRTYVFASLRLAGRQDEAFEALMTIGDDRLRGSATEYREKFRHGGLPAVSQMYLERVPPKIGWRPVHKRWAVLFLHRTAEAIGMVEELERQHDSWIMQLEDPIYDEIRSEPRFKALLKRVGYPESMWR